MYGFSWMMVDDAECVRDIIYTLWLMIKIDDINLSRTIIKNNIYVIDDIFLTILLYQVRS